MSWFFEIHTFPSEKNGLIIYRRILGKWEIVVKGYAQTGAYLKSVWQDALSRNLVRLPVRNILALGLGGGAILSLLRRQFPSAQITVIEWDPVMVQISRDLHLCKLDEHVNLIVGDAAEVVPELTQKFDLVCCDLFLGNTIPDFVAQVPFLLHMRRILSRQGVLIMNLSLQTDMIQPLSEIFDLQATWKFQYNNLASFVPK